MSKISSEFLKKSISEIMSGEGRKQRKFIESVELQITLRDYDPEKRFGGVSRLPNKVHSKIRVCVLRRRFV